MRAYQSNKSGADIDRLLDLAEKALQPIGNAGSHNSIYRGKALGSLVTAEQWNAISRNTFDDLYIGDYWTINEINWRIAAFNYWLHTGDTECTTPHVVIVPDTNLVGNIPINDTNTTVGAYVGSDFYTGNNDNTGKAQCISLIQSAFGSSHILNHKEYLKNTVSNGYESAAAWYNSTIELMTEQMVYGGKCFGNIINGTNVPASYTIDNSQLPLFVFDHSHICNRSRWWLRDIVSEALIATVDTSGFCNSTSASNRYAGIRPVFGICA